MRDTVDVSVGGATLRCHIAGSGPPVVLLHGLLADATLWRDVVPHLAPHVQCIAPDLPLGAHQVTASRHADLSPNGLATMVARLLQELDLNEVTLVGNDTGGAIAQLVAADHPERIGRLVLTPCDMFDNFLPLPLRYLQWVSRLPGSAWLIVQALRVRALHRLPIAFGWLTVEPVDRERMDAWLAPSRRSSDIRRDLRRVLRSIDPAATLHAARALAAFDRPTLMIWATEDRLFPVEHARRLAASMPLAEVVELPDCRTFLPIDAPDELAERLLAFVTGGPTP